MSERWQSLKEIFQEAIEHEPSERGAFLEKACGGDLELRGELEELLACHEDDGSFLERAVGEAAGELLADGHGESLIGRTLGGYQVLSLLGRGGMGEVYLAEDTRLGRKVALKLLPALFTSNPDRLRRFQQEARSASALNHPNILTIHEIGEMNGVHFISTEYIDGETLRERIERAPLTVDEVLDIAVQVASALNVAHQAGIVHRDIKPENIMLRRDGYVKVLDFGLAKLSDESAAGASDAPGREVPRALSDRPENGSANLATQALGSTATGALMGTARYMSPEQAMGHPIDGRTDIWSLGVVIFEMLAGVPPFRGDGTSEFISSILKDAPRPLAELVPGVPTELEQAIGKCLEKDRQRRYQSAQELHHQLAGLKARRAARTPDEPKKHSVMLAPRFLAVAFSVIALLLATLLAYTLSRVPSNRVLPEIKSVAVLPLTDLSYDPAQEYFADGVTEGLINELARVESLQVISRTSATRYRNRQATLPQIARELNVDAIVEGTVLRSGGSVRTVLKLTHATTGLQLWAGSYERDLRDVVALQQQVARDITGEIQIPLTPQERIRLTNARRVNPEAYEHYFKGRRYLDKRNTEAINKAIELFDQAIAEDPQFALAQAALADAYFALGTVHLSALPPLEALEKGRQAAVRAVELDDTLAEGHTALAVIHFYSWEWAAAEEEFKRALELNPNYAPAHSWYAIYSAARGRVGEAISRIYRARDLDPLSPHISQNVGWILTHARQYDEAIEQYQRSLELDPDFLFARMRLATAYLEKGMFEEALAELEKINARRSQNPNLVGQVGYQYAIMGKTNEARVILKELIDLRERKYVNPHAIGIIYLGLGEKDQAFEWLEKSYQEHSYVLVFLKVGDEFDPIRSDPRFADLLRRVGLGS